MGPRQLIHPRSSHANVRKEKKEMITIPFPIGCPRTLLFACSFEDALCLNQQDLAHKIPTKSFLKHTYNLHNNVDLNYYNSSK